METILLTIFGRVYAQAGASGALVVVAVFGLMALSAKWMLFRIESGKVERDARERERGATLAELHVTQEKFTGFMASTLNEARVEGAKQGAVLSRICESMQEQVLTSRAIADDLKAHREEERGRAAQFHEKLNDVELRIAEMKPKA